MNGIPVAGKQPHDIVKILAETTKNGSVTFKLIPIADFIDSPQMQNGHVAHGEKASVYLRAFFDYCRNWIISYIPKQLSFKDLGISKL